MRQVDSRKTSAKLRYSRAIVELRRASGAARMLTAFVLVCSLALTPDLRECSRDNAVHVLRVPEEFAMPAMCAARGQAFLAETSVRQELATDERVKVSCVRLVPVGRRVI